MSQFFERLPSVNDLLEFAPLKGLLDRVGKNHVVSETTQFLDRMRREAQHAAQQALSTNPQELAQRVARWIISAPATAPRTIINATGVLLAYEPPLSAAAIDAMAAASEYQSSEGYAQAVAGSLKRLTGAESAIVLSSPAAAMAAAVAALSPDKPIILSRGELERDPHEPTIAELAQVLGTTIREVGSINETRASDYEAHLADAGLAIVITPRFASFGASVHRPATNELAQLARRFGTPMLVDLGWGSVNALAPIDSAWPHAAEAIKAGSDVVLLRGQGLLGGPACGVLLGRKELIDRIAADPLARTAIAASSVTAALAATLVQFEEPASIDQHNPLRLLLATDVENLRLRAERLAPQIAVGGIAGAAEPVQTASYLSTRRMVQDALPSWAIAVSPKDFSVRKLAEKLLAGPQPIAAMVENDRLLVNLRSVHPRHDLAIVEAFTAAPAQTTSEEPSVQPAL